MSNGWVRLHRTILQSEVFAEEHLFRLFVWLMLRAAYKRQSVSMQTGRGQTVVTLQPGQCIVGRNTGAIDLNWKPSTFRDRLARLQSIGVISIQPSPHWTIVSLANWPTYQEANDTATTSKRQANGPRSNRASTQAVDCPEALNDNQTTDKQHPNNTQTTQTKKSKKAKKVEKIYRQRSKKPTIDEVRNYCKERKNKIDPQRFHAYYEANGWTQGKGKPIRDWQAAVRNWEHNSAQDTRQATLPTDIDLAALAKERRARRNAS